MIMGKGNSSDNTKGSWLLGGGLAILGLIGLNELTEERKNRLITIANESKKVSPSVFEIKTSIGISVDKETEYDLSQFQESSYSSEEVKSILSSIGGNALELVLEKSSLNELLKCNVPIDLLTSAKDGSGMLGNVMENGRISEQARFSRAGLESLAPVLIFQLLSTITGQYYMHVLSSQLNELNNKVDWVINKLKNEEKSRFQRIKQDVQKYLYRTEYAQDECNSFIEDIRFLKEKVLEYENEYDTFFVLQNVEEGVICNKVLAKLNSNVDNCIEIYTKLINFSYLLFLAHICRFKMLCYRKESKNLMQEEFMEIRNYSFIKIQNLFLKHQYISRSFVNKINKEFFDSNLFTEKQLKSFKNKWKNVQPAYNDANEMITNTLCLHIYCDEQNNLKLLTMKNNV